MSSIRELPAANSAHGIRCLNRPSVGFPCGSRSKVILVMSNSIRIAKQIQSVLLSKQMSNLSAWLRWSRISATGW